VRQFLAIFALGASLVGLSACTGNTSGANLLPKTPQSQSIGAFPVTIQPYPVSIGAFPVSIGAFPVSKATQPQATVGPQIIF
jgi:hypothetical protein